MRGFYNQELVGGKKKEREGSMIGKGRSRQINEKKIKEKKENCF